MSVTVESLSEMLNVHSEEDVAALTRLLAAAESRITNYLRGGRMPEAERDVAVESLVNELWLRRNSPGGVASWSPEGTVPVRFHPDAIFPIRPMLDPHRGRPAIG